MPVLLDTTQPCEDRLDDQSSGLLAKNSETAPTEERLTMGVDHDGTKRWRQTERFLIKSNFLRLIDADATKHRLQGGRIFLVQERRI